MNLKWRVQCCYEVMCILISLNYPVVPVFKMRYIFPGTKPGSVRLEKSPSKNDLIRLFVIQEFGNREFKFRPLEILQLQFFFDRKNVQESCCNAPKVVSIYIFFYYKNVYTHCRKM